MEVFMWFLGFGFVSLSIGFPFYFICYIEGRNRVKKLKLEYDYKVFKKQIKLDYENK
jgi:hypothetical protein